MSNGVVNNSRETLSAQKRDPGSESLRSHMMGTLTNIFHSENENRWKE